MELQGGARGRAANVASDEACEPARPEGKLPCHACVAARKNILMPAIMARRPFSKTMFHLVVIRLMSSRCVKVKPVCPMRLLEVPI